MASLKAKARKVVCIGRNYADHITELASARPSQPFFFLKPPSAILPPQTGPIIRPRGVTLHHEVELGLVIGKAPAPASGTSNITSGYKNISQSSVVLPNESTNRTGSMISHYFLSIDLTARNVQDEAKKKGLPWSIAKGFDTFLPVSEVIETNKIPDPHNIEIWLSVNGQMKQEGNTNLMLFDIPRMLSDISKVMTLEEGDLILTGTPKGVGPLQGGDKVRCGLRVDGKELDEAKIEVDVVDAQGGDEVYQFKET